MAISENAADFCTQQVKDFSGPDDWKGPGYAYRIPVDYDSEEGLAVQLLEDLAAQKDAAKLQAIVIGMWGSASDDPSTAIVQTLCGLKDRFVSVRAIFLGDITYEENEISWIVQSDLAPL